MIATNKLIVLEFSLLFICCYHTCYQTSIAYQLSQIIDISQTSSLNQPSSSSSTSIKHMDQRLVKLNSLTTVPARVPY